MKFIKTDPHGLVILEVASLDVLASLLGYLIVYREKAEELGFEEKHHELKYGVNHVAHECRNRTIRKRRLLTDGK